MHAGFNAQQQFEKSFVARQTNLADQMFSVITNSMVFCCTHAKWLRVEITANSLDRKFENFAMGTAFAFVVRSENLCKVNALADSLFTCLSHHEMVWIVDLWFVCEVKPPQFCSVPPKKLNFVIKLEKVVRCQKDLRFQKIDANFQIFLLRTNEIESETLLQTKVMRQAKFRGMLNLDTTFPWETKSLPFDRNAWNAKQVQHGMCLSRPSTQLLTCIFWRSSLQQLLKRNSEDFNETIELNLTLPGMYCLALNKRY